MLQSVVNAVIPADLNEEETEEDFEVIIDQPYFCVVRTGQYFVGQLHTPCDLGEMGWQLAGHGYVMDEVIAFHDGVIEMLLRPLGEVSVDTPEREQQIMAEVAEYIKEREGQYA